MNCQRTRDTFPDLLDARAGSAVSAEVRAHLAGCADCQREFSALQQTAAVLDAMPTPEPSPRLRKNFYAMLADEQQSPTSAARAAQSPAGARRAAWWRFLLAPLAGCALVAVGFLAGRQAQPVQVAADTTTRTELKKLQEQMNKMGQLVGVALLQQQQGPANERLQGVLVSARSAQPSDKILDDLISALAFDPNANIRLRALEALTPHADRALVRAGVLAALPREENPLVQLELIDFVAAAHDSAATPVLERLAQNEATERNVRDAARTALAQF